LGFAASVREYVDKGSLYTPRVEADELDARLYELRARGAPPIEAIKVIRDAQGVSLGEAKRFFAVHPAWADVHEAAQPLHDAAEQAAREWAEGS
jgi:ribosomal protein L7/L12